MSLGWELEKIGSGVGLMVGILHRRVPNSRKFARRFRDSRFAHLPGDVQFLTIPNPTRFLGRLPAIFGPFAGPKVHQIRGPKNRFYP